MEKRDYKQAREDAKAQVIQQRQAPFRKAFIADNPGISLPSRHEPAFLGRSDILCASFVPTPNLGLGTFGRPSHPLPLDAGTDTTTGRAAGLGEVRKRKKAERAASAVDIFNRC